MRRAARTDANQRAIVAAMRDEGATVVLTHRVGGGFPDCVVGINGVTGLVEIKVPGGGLKDAQIAFWDTWLGGPIAQVTDEEGARRFVRMLNPFREPMGS